MVESRPLVAKKPISENYGTMNRRDLLSRAAVALAALPSSRLQGAPMPGLTSNLSGLDVFTARPPYTVQTAEKLHRVRLGISSTKDDLPRRFDLVDRLFNPVTGRLEAQTWQVADPDAPEGLAFRTINDASQPGPRPDGVRHRIEKRGSNLFIAYLAGDPPGDACRAMINTWPVPTRRKLVWDLSFKLGSADDGLAWPLLPPKNNEVLVWQLKTEPAHPTIALIVDTDSRSKGTLALHVHQRSEAIPKENSLAVVRGLEPETFIDVVIESVLDDRPLEQGGTGYIIVWVNGQLAASFEGQTLIAERHPHRWAFGAYLPGFTRPAPYNRATLWRRARMLA